MQNSSQYKLTPGYLIRRIWKIIIIIILVLIIGTVGGWYIQTQSSARLALAEAKNVQLAVNLMSSSAYASNVNMYDAASASGISEEYIEQIRQFADVDGTLYITDWNRDYNEMEAFHYVTGKYTVYYTYDFEDAQASWRVDYSMPMIGY